VSADRDGATVRLRVRQDDGIELDAVALSVAAPRAGDRVSVDVDAAGVVEVPLWRRAFDSSRPRE
jgi:hypothetical protein